MVKINNGLAKVFNDAVTHRTVADIIAKHLSNKRDVRAEALDELDLLGCHTLYDLGCGFGFFTSGLHKRVAPDARITGIDCHNRYRDMFLDASEQAGIKGYFDPGGVQSIKSIQQDSVDLVICSYAMYFFPEYINQIARILQPDGTFITITHSCSHLKDFILLVKSILKKNNIPFQDPCPYEDLVSNFTDENGFVLLSNVFGKVRCRPFRGKLIFTTKDYDSFKKYFMFKVSFFIPRHLCDDEKVMVLILDDLQHYIMTHGEISITIDDMIFICNDPLVSQP